MKISTRIKNYALCFLSFLLIMCITTTDSYSEAKDVMDTYEAEVISDTNLSADEVIDKLTATEIVEGGSLLDNFFEWIGAYIDTLAAYFGNKFVQIVTKGFDPSFNTILDIVNGDSIGTTTISTKDDVLLNTDLGAHGGIVTLARGIGLVLANLMLVWFLLLCIFGRSEQIKATPIQLIFNYIIAVGLIYLSFDITWEIMEIASNIWENFVMQTNGNTLTYAHFAQLRKFDVDGVIILGIKIATTYAWLISTACPFICVYFIWKLFKQFLRLYIEIVERYFVTVLLMLFFPAVIPTMISPGTSNIVKSYMRMMFSQLFIIVANGMFMKIFISVLIRGGWTCSIINYICALGFMRVCQRLDTYMLTMGLNVAQTGGGFLDSLGGGMNFLGGTLRSLASPHTVGSVMKASGKATMKKAVASNNFGQFVTGFNTSDMIGSIVRGQSGTQALAARQFSEAMANKDTAPTGTITNIGGKADNLASAKQTLGVPSMAYDKLAAQGVTPQKIDHIEKTGKGSYAFRDRAGNTIATTNGENVQVNSDLLNGESIAMDTRTPIEASTVDSASIVTQGMDDNPSSFAESAIQIDDNNNSKLAEVHSINGPVDDKDMYLSPQETVNSFGSGWQIQPETYGSQSKISWSEGEEGSQKFLATREVRGKNGSTRTEMAIFSTEKAGYATDYSGSKNVKYRTNENGDTIQITKTPYKINAKDMNLPSQSTKTPHNNKNNGIERVKPAKNKPLTEEAIQDDMANKIHNS